MDNYTVAYFVYLICQFQPDCMRWKCHRYILIQMFLLTFYWSYIEIDNEYGVLWLRYAILAQMIQILLNIVPTFLRVAGFISSNIELIIQSIGIFLQIPSGWIFVQGLYYFEEMNEPASLSFAIVYAMVLARHLLKHSFLFLIQLFWPFLICFYFVARAQQPAFFRVIEAEGFSGIWRIQFFIQAAGFDMQPEAAQRLANLRNGRIDGLSEAEIKKIPIETIQNIADRPKYDDCCAICLEQYKVNDKVMRLPTCRHILHEECGKIVYKDSGKCPFCRALVMPQLEGYEMQETPQINNNFTPTYQQNDIRPTVIN